ncbi:MAG: hypothetical protein ACRDWY_10990 [Actinomycetes bacterium]
MSERDRPEDGRADVEAALRRLARQVDVPPTPDYVTRVTQHLDVPTGGPREATGPAAKRLRSVHPVVATGIALVVAFAVVLSVPATREAVADLFGLSGVRVRPLPTAAPSPRTTIDRALDLGRLVTLDEARRRAPFTVSVPSAAGLTTPDAVYLRRGPGLESVSLVYRPRAGFPPAIDTRVGLLLSEFAGSATPYFEKFIGPGSNAEPVTVGGQWPGLYFPQPQQVLVRDPRGVVHEHPPRLAAPTLVWVRGGVTYRLEANIDRARALEVAASLG